MTKLQDYIEESFETEIITSWKHQNQMHNFKILQEIFDADVELKTTYSNKEFRAYFSAANNDWIFHAIKLSLNISLNPGKLIIHKWKSLPNQ